MRETWVWFLDWEDPLEEGMGKRSSILALEIPWTEEPGRLYSSWGCRVGHDWATSLFFFTFIMLGLLSRSVMYDSLWPYALPISKYALFHRFKASFGSLQVFPYTSFELFLLNLYLALLFILLKIIISVISVKFECYWMECHICVQSFPLTQKSQCIFSLPIFKIDFFIV